ncbi:hypothetical protein [Salinibacter sp.]|uniref:hypothetical protein n=1 Tax=Salinibacter sp. TaxID=2065818 RepID=UPI0021E9970B|nr:hypothetical protein [Salinibacter sp.]
MQLTEAVWEPGGRPDLEEALRSSVYDANAVLSRRRAWAAYLDTPSPQIVLCARHLERDEDFPALSEYLKAVDCSSLQGCLYATDTYYQSRVLGEPLPGNRDLQAPADPTVNDVLSSSKGILLWHHQLESLAQSLGFPRHEAIDLRRKVNQKRASVLDSAEEHEFLSGRTLGEVIENRLFYGSVVPGQWQAARRLLDSRR